MKTKAIQIDALQFVRQILIASALWYAAECVISHASANELGEGSPDGIIDDPDGYVNLRKEQSADSLIVAKVKKDEPFWFQCPVTNGERTGHDEWCNVKLKSGVTGWMHYSRIKFYYTEKDLPKGPQDSGDEIEDQTHKRGIEYCKIARAAAHGDKRALRTFFTLGLDGAAAETHITAVVPVVIHLLGDDKFAAFLREEPHQFREDIGTGWELGFAYPLDPKEYFQRHFPESAKLIFREEN